MEKLYYKIKDYKTKLDNVNPISFYSIVTVLAMLPMLMILTLSQNIDSFGFFILGINLTFTLIVVSALFYSMFDKKYGSKQEINIEQELSQEQLDAIAKLEKEV